MEKNFALIVVGILVCLFLVAVLIVPMIAVQEVEATVTGFAQTRTSIIERREEVREEGWSIPRDAFNFTSHVAVKSVHKVSDGFRHTYRITCHDIATGTDRVCMQTGNQVPPECAALGMTCSKELIETQEIFHEEKEYATKYTYNILRWMYSRRVVTSSSSHQSGALMPVELAVEERIGSDSMAYKVFFQTDEGDKYTYYCPLTEWQQIQEGQRKLVTVNLFGGVLRVDSVRDP